MHAARQTETAGGGKGMILIVTHDNADFDAIASSFLLSKIFKNAKILRPSGMEYEVEVFLKRSSLNIPFTDMPGGPVREVIFSDCGRNEHLLRSMKEGKPHITVLDHHAAPAYGSNVSLVYHKYAERIGRINCEEALLFLLGIYQDTGGLTYHSTKEADFKASSFFIKFEPRIEQIPQYIKYFDITDKNLAILSDIIERGVMLGPPACPIMVSAYPAVKYYSGYSALLNHILNIKNIKALFTLFIFRKKIILSARSSTEKINVNAILNELKKGKGHILASSRAFKGISPHELERKLKKTLTEYIFRNKVKFFLDLSGKNRKEYASVSGMTLWDFFEETIKNGEKSEEKYGSLAEYLIPEGFRRSPLLPANELKKYRDALHLKKHLFRALPQNVKRILFEIKKLSGKRPERLYIVGGVVRDIVLAFFAKERCPEFHEIDILVEHGNAISFASALKKVFPAAKFHIYESFNTATLKFPDFSLDFATARKEFYSAGGALPKVEKADLGSDLSRRDFTVSAMAIGLNRDDYGSLYDYFGGQRDIRLRKLRILHAKSFFDDPTRMLRLIRFKNTLDFTVEKNTQHLLDATMNFGITEFIKGFRLTRELRLLLNCKDPIRAVNDLFAFNMMRELFGIDEIDSDLIRNINTNINWFSILHPGLLIRKDLIFLGYFLKISPFSDFKDILHFNKKDGAVIDEILKVRIPKSFTARTKFSTYERHFAKAFPETLIFLMSIFAEEQRERFIKYVLRTIEYKPILGGDALLREGVQDIRIGAVMDAVKGAFLDGTVKNEKEALLFVRKLRER